MLSSDLQLALVLAELRIRQARQEAGAQRLLHQAQNVQPGWASQQARRLLHAMAHGLVGAGQRLHDYARSRPVLVPGEVNSR